MRRKSDKLHFIGTLLSILVSVSVLVLFLKSTAGPAILDHMAVQSHEKRISSVEACLKENTRWQDTHEGATVEMNKRLDRIENKIDRLLH